MSAIKVKVGRKVVLGTSLLSLIKRTRVGLGLNAKWSKPVIYDDGSSIQVVPLNSPGIELVAWKLQPNSRLTCFFPSGAMVVVIDGKLLVADKSSPTSNGHRKFGYSMTLLLPLGMKLIKEETDVNFCSDDVETTFIVHQPGGFKIPLARD